MLTGLSHLALDARSWPFEQARALLTRVLNQRFDSHDKRDLVSTWIHQGKADEAIRTFPEELLNRAVLFETGYGPSGLPHLGTFGEVARTTMVRNAFRALTDDKIPTRLICFSDDMDGMRKVPDNVPNPEALALDLGKPLTSVRDPFGTHDSFGAHNNARLRAFLDTFGFDYEFKSSTQTYRSGEFDDALLAILAKYDKVMAVMLPTLGEERRETYSPFLPVSPRSGKVLLAKVVQTDPHAGTITYVEEDGSHETVPVTGGACKLQWKPDMGMRWAALGVDYEMYGKDHLPSAKLYDAICRIAGGEPPQQFMFELFLDDKGEKISKSKGNGLSMDEWLRYGAPETLAYYNFQSPKSAKRLHFDVIPKAADEYLQQLEAYNRADTSPVQKLDNPVWSVHGGAPPKGASPVSFNLLLNLVSAADASEKSILWGFLGRYIPGASAETHPVLDRMADYALHYYEDFVKPSKRFRPPSDQERAAMLDLVARLKALPAGADAEAIQGEVYEAGKAAGFEPLRAWFSALYEVLLGQSQGPRFGSFVALFGVERSIALIEEKLG